MRYFVGFILSSDKTKRFLERRTDYASPRMIFFISCICLGLTTNCTDNWKVCISTLTINITYQQALVPWNVGKLLQSPGPWWHQIHWKYLCFPLGKHKSFCEFILEIGYLLQSWWAPFGAFPRGKAMITCGSSRAIHKVQLLSSLTSWWE